MFLCNYFQFIEIYHLDISQGSRNLQRQHFVTSVSPSVHPNSATSASKNKNIKNTLFLHVCCNILLTKQIFALDICDFVIKIYFFFGVVRAGRAVDGSP